MYDTDPAPDETTADLSFEASLSALKEHVEVLERGEVPLAEAMARFRGAQALGARCGELLDEAQAEFELVSSPPS